MKWKRAKKLKGERACMLGVHSYPIDMLIQLHWIWGRLNIVPYCGDWFDPEDRLWFYLNLREFDKFRRAA